MIFLYNESKRKENIMFRSKKKNKNIHGFMEGELITLDKVSDPVFSQKMMGDGFAIEPTDNHVYAPCDGELTVVFPTYHAYGITMKSGVEVLLHLGIDTVELDGDGFTTKVKVGDKVKAGDLLGTMDVKRIKELEKPTTSMLILTSGETVNLLKDANTTVSKDDVVAEYE